VCLQEVSWYDLQLSVCVKEQVEMEETTETDMGVFGLNHVIPVSTM